MILGDVVGKEVLIPHTLPRCPLDGVFVDEVVGTRIRYRDKAPRWLADCTPYHFVQGERGLTLRKGAPPKAVKEAAAMLANGSLDVGGFLDRIGVPK